MRGGLLISSSSEYTVDLRGAVDAICLLSSRAELA